MIFGAACTPTRDAKGGSMKLQVCIIRIEQREPVQRDDAELPGLLDIGPPACILLVRLGPWQFVTCLDQPVDETAEDAPGDDGARVWLAS
jgi:hypothetical protein